MNINPHTCPHNLSLSLTYDGTFAIVRCMDCDTTWDADEPIPMSKRDTRVSFDHGDENDTWENHPEWREDDETRVCLNPDNEPTSDHMQYERTSKCSDQ